MTARAGVVLALIASFLFGCTAGAMGAFVTVHLVSGHFGGPGGGHHHGPGQMGPMMQRLGHSLDLTPNQQQRFDRILDRSGSRMAALRESTQVELEQVLTPAQRDRWQHMEHRFLHFRPPDGPPGTGPPDDGP